MGDIYVSEEEKKKIDVIIQRGETTAKRIEAFVSEIMLEKELNLRFMRESGLQGIT